MLGFVRGDAVLRAARNERSFRRTHCSHDMLDTSLFIMRAASRFARGGHASALNQASALRSDFKQRW
jgi:hypothetical protein